MPKKLLCLPTSERSTRLSLSLWERELRPTVTVGKRASSFGCHCGKESFVLPFDAHYSEHVCVSHDTLYSEFLIINRPDTSPTAIRQRHRSASPFGVASRRRY